MICTSSCENHLEESAGQVPRHKIRIVLADDHAVLREGLRALLEQEPDIEVVDDVGDGEAAVRAAVAYHPDVIVMDIGMPYKNGVDATKDILALYPDARIICLSVHHSRTFVRAMLKSGARGYLLKTSASSEVVKAIRRVAAGEIYLNGDLGKAEHFS